MYMLCIPVYLLIYASSLSTLWEQPPDSFNIIVRAIPPGVSCSAANTVPGAVQALCPDADPREDEF